MDKKFIEVSQIKERKSEKKLTVKLYGGVNTISSLEVAEMIDKSHDKLLRDIRGYIEVISHSPKLESENFFIKSEYVNTRNQRYPCYLLTKQGCEMVANKMTGEKGILFTATYVQAFNEMENSIKEPKKLSAIEQLQLQNQAILEVNEKVENLENNLPLFNVECKELQAAVKKLGVELMGGKITAAYKDNSLRGKVYSDIQKELKRQFQVTRYEAIKRCQLPIAYEILGKYELPLVLKSEIEAINNQISFNK